MKTEQEIEIFKNELIDRFGEIPKTELNQQLKGLVIEIKFSICDFVACCRPFVINLSVREFDL